jgi:glycosyltransferase involved in cell wall biosynthesis
MISLFTPSHNPSKLGELYESLLEQDYTDWEWVILLNNGATSEFKADDKRVKVFHDETGNTRVGYLKREACQRCTGDILLEMDHDDLLLPGALSEVAKAFEDPSVDFVYSNTVNHDVRFDTPVTWSDHWGWSQRDFEYKGKKYIESVSAEPDPQSISRIWFAPNHLRAWRTLSYWKIGGHDPSMPITDDHDLMMRTWLYGKMHHIDKPLYLYRVTGDNTWLKNQDDIQVTMWNCHDKYIGKMAEKWADQNGLKKIDICSGPRPEQGYISVDKYNGDVLADLDQRWPFEESSVGVVRASDAIEHLKDPIHTMNEAYRVLAHGGFFFIAVPSTSGAGAWCDPTHVSFWNSRSFDYYTRPDVQAFIKPMADCKFQALKVVDGSMWGLPYVFAHLVAIKPNGAHYYGENLWR